MGTFQLRTHPCDFFLLMYVDPTIIYYDNPKSTKIKFKVMTYT